MFGTFVPRYFYEDDGVTLKEEPEESLEELIADYRKACECYNVVHENTKKKESKYETVKDGKKVIDYDKWEEDNEDEMMTYGLADFNAGEWLEILKWEIDLKIMHINARGRESFG